MAAAHVPIFDLPAVRPRVHAGLTHRSRARAVRGGAPRRHRSWSGPSLGLEWLTAGIRVGFRLFSVFCIDRFQPEDERIKRQHFVFLTMPLGNEIERRNRAPLASRC